MTQQTAKPREAGGLSLHLILESAEDRGGERFGAALRFGLADAQFLRHRFEMIGKGTR